MPVHRNTAAEQIAKPAAEDEDGDELTGDPEDKEGGV